MGPLRGLPGSFIGPLRRSDSSATTTAGQIPTRSPPSGLPERERTRAPGLYPFPTQKFLLWFLSLSPHITRAGFHYAWPVLQVLDKQ